MKFLLTLFLAFVCLSFGFAQSLLYGAPSAEQGHDKLVVHTIFTVMYDLEKENPDWVAEFLTKEDVDSEAVQRKGFHFADDPLIEGEAKDADFVGSGYDRGHMAPAEDMELNATLMTECFYMTNMVPQKHALNGGKWKEMEDVARKVAVKEGKAWIFSGPIYRTPNPGECYGVIGGKEKIVVPQAFFKVIVFEKDGVLKSIDFVIPHLQGPASSYGSLASYLTSIDEVEKETGFDFLNKLPVETQTVVEAAVTSPQELAVF